MKKDPTIFHGLVESVSFPNKGKVIPVVPERSESEAPAAGFSVSETPIKPVHVKNVLPGQTVEVFQSNHQRKRREGTLRQVIAPAPYEVPSPCPHAQFCGGCSYQTVPYDVQLQWKSDMVQQLLDEVLDRSTYQFLPIHSSPIQYGYRNKMEFSFGDEYKDGPLALGLHKQGAHHDIVPVTDCQIVHPDFRTLLKGVLAYFTEAKSSYYNTRSHTGFLRHLVVRRSFKDNGVMVNLVTSSDGTLDKQAFVEYLTALPLEGKLSGILHTVNDSLADVVQADSLEVLYGEPDLTEGLLGLSFHLSPFSFFQTNTLGAEVLYQTVLDMAGDIKDLTLFDLYCGTGTITQILAHGGAKQVLGIELIAEAVDAARENAALNGLTNCSFQAGDVLKLVDTLEVHPDLIVLDPPRDGIHPKALPKILAYQPDRFIYVSCKPTSLVRDIPAFVEAGYKVEKVQCVDMFPGTVHVETVVCLSREKADESEKESNMISDERSKYKSWSNLKKQMNNLLCDSLKDKITYFYTSYHEVHNAYGRATIQYENKEMAAFSWDREYEQGEDIIEQYKKMDNVPSFLEDYEGSLNAFKTAKANVTKEKWMPNCTLREMDFINSITIYLKTDIATSLNSDNYLLRVFAYMDRRVGKRTLIKIKDDVEKLPDWVKQFYQIRCEADGIVFPPKRITEETVALLSK